MPKKEKKKESRSLRETVLRSMEIPEDVAGRAPIITATGSAKVVIENYRNILSYTCDEIVVMSFTGKICIQGTDLELLAYSSEEMVIQGNICSVWMKMP